MVAAGSVALASVFSAATPVRFSNALALLATWFTPLPASSTALSTTTSARSEVIVIPLRYMPLTTFCAARAFLRTSARNFDADSCKAFSQRWSTKRTTRWLPMR